MSSSDCPSRNVLIDWALGRLHESQAQAVEAHLDVCAVCEQYATSVHLFSTEQLQIMRPGFVAEQECSQVVNQVLGQLDLPLSEEIARRQQAGTWTGLRIRDYRLTALLGRGGMGAVYRAEHTVLKKDVAIKILPQQSTDDASAAARFQREMQAVGRLDHRHIVRALDAGQVEGISFLVMDLIEGVDLSSLTHGRRRFSLEESCEIGRQLAEGLACVHGQGLIHRDVKPSNVMLSLEADGRLRVRILDLGLALLPESESQNAPLTAESQLVGTLEYMSPEQTETTEDLDHRVDIYALGVTLYRLLSGFLPFHGKPFKSPVRRLKALTTEDPVSVAVRVPGLPVSLVNLVDSMISRDPCARPQSMQGVLSVLRQFAPAVPLSRLPEPLQPVQQADAQEDTSMPPADARSMLAADTSPTAMQTRITPGGRLARSTASRAGIIGRTLVFGVLALLSAAIWWSRTDGGRLQVDSVAAAQVRLTLVDAESGAEARQLVVSGHGGQYWIRAGRYRLLAKSTAGDVELDRGELQMTRGGRLTVRISRPAGLTDRPIFATTDARSDDADDTTPLRGIWQYAECLPEPINSGGKDDQATVSADGLVMIFSSYSLPRASGHGDRDLWITRRSTLNGPWAKPRNLGPAINSPQKEMKPCYHQASRTLIFASNRAGGLGGDDLWFTRHSADFSTWSTPVNPGSSVNSAADEGRSTISTDGLRLYFCSSRNARTAGSNLWRVRRSDTREDWGAAEELTALNSPFKDSGPCLSSDGRTLLFTSDRPGGLGDRDLWLCTRSSQAAEWSSPVNAGPVINTTASESHPCLVPGGRELIFASQREAGHGGNDLWVVRHTPDVPCVHPRPASDAPDIARVPFHPRTADALQQAWARHWNIPVTWENSIGMPLQLIPPGEFMMGSGRQEHRQAMKSRLESRPSRMNAQVEAELIKSEAPPRKVFLTEPFYLGTVEVRERDYDAIIGSRPPMKSRGSDFPVGMIPWLRAARFCNELSLREGMPPRYEIDGRQVRLLPQAAGYRLPTEAQWEFACRAGSNDVYPFGNDPAGLEDVAWSGLPVDQYLRESFPVGQKAANAFGLFDMLGNHWEWCEDPFDPTDHTWRIARGGFVLSVPMDLRSARRRRHLAHMNYWHGGFRVVLKLPDPTDEPEDRATVNRATP
ncbi:MAG: SUMF1/EgtB/PvdO family nonheme iron enzyme [Planctomycetaceae bacterium]|nr:SUMF1/EgtB/PvdO family nonheme iron enzyme [Planctomycetaceae bacterium]